MNAQYWIEGKEINRVSHLEIIWWIAKTFPKLNEKHFPNEAFLEKEDKIYAIEQMIKFHKTLEFIFNYRQINKRIDENDRIIYRH